MLSTHPCVNEEATVPGVGLGLQLQACPLSAPRTEGQRVHPVALPSIASTHDLFVNQTTHALRTRASKLGMAWRSPRSLLHLQGCGHDCRDARVAEVGDGSNVGQEPGHDSGNLKSL